MIEFESAGFALPETLGAPRTALAEAAGLAVARGIVVDDTLRTDDPAISAIGALILQLFSAWRTARAPSGLCAPSTITSGPAAAN